MSKIFFIISGFLIFIIIFYILRKKRTKKFIEKELSVKGFDSLVNNLKSKDLLMKEEAIIKLGDIEAPRSIDTLINFLNLPEVKEEEGLYFASLAINSLFKKDDKKAVDFLIDLLKRGDEGYKFLVCQGILALKEDRKSIFKGAVEPLLLYFKYLLEAKERKDENFHKDYLISVEDALEYLTGQNFGSDFEKWEKYLQNNKK